MGSESKYDDIFREYYTKLYHHAFSFLRDTDMARDVVNDAFEALWKSFSVHRKRGTAVPYLYSVVRNKCVDILRRHTIHNRYIQANAPEGAFREEYDYTDYDARLELLRLHIDALPAQTRNVFILCYIDGYSYNEAADRLGISPNTVKTLLSRAMKTLREVYAADPHST